MNRVFQAFDRSIPIGLTSLQIRELAEQIANSKRMPIEEVETRLKNLQTEASSAINTQKDRQRRGLGIGYRLFC